MKGLHAFLQLQLYICSAPRFVSFFKTEQYVLKKNSSLILGNFHPDFIAPCIQKLLFSQPQDDTVSLIHS